MITNMMKKLFLLILTLSATSFAAAQPTSEQFRQLPQYDTADEFLVFAPIIQTSQISGANPNDRGRVQIADGTLKADNGELLRGEHLRISEMLAVPPTRTETERMYDVDVWNDLIVNHHLNTVRLLMYRPPQHWDSTDPNGCSNPPERCYASVNDILPHLDTAVEIASQMGMYVIIDYHPVGGYYKDDAVAWWTAIAPRYKDRTHVIYEVTNEPSTSAGSYSAELVQYEEDMYTLIRSLAPDTHIILWSFAEWSGSNHDMLDRIQEGPDINYTNASVGFHPYSSLNPNELFALNAAGLAIINTEIGGYSRDEYVQRTAAMEQWQVNNVAKPISWVWLDGSGYEKDWAETNPVPVTWPQDPGTRPTVVTGFEKLPLLPKSTP